MNLKKTKLIKQRNLCKVSELPAHAIVLYRGIAMLVFPAAHPQGQQYCLHPTTKEMLFLSDDLLVDLLMTAEEAAWLVLDVTRSDFISAYKRLGLSAWPQGMTVDADWKQLANPRVMPWPARAFSECHVVQITTDAGKTQMGVAYPSEPATDHFEVRLRDGQIVRIDREDWLQTLSWGDMNALHVALPFVQFALTILRELKPAFQIEEGSLVQFGHGYAVLRRNHPHTHGLFLLSFSGVQPIQRNDRLKVVMTPQQIGEAALAIECANWLQVYAMLKPHSGKLRIGPLPEFWDEGPCTCDYPASCLPCHSIVTHLDQLGRLTTTDGRRRPVVETITGDRYELSKQQGVGLRASSEDTWRLPLFFLEGIAGLPVTLSPELTCWGKMDEELPMAA